MVIIHCILWAIFILISFFCLLSIGYYAGRMRELSIRQKVCDDIKKQIPNCSEEWLNGAVYVISRLNDMNNT
jgi:hypothetical protein